ncbi:MAG TPA: peptidylprolyl isomerase [Hyphomicrobiales bacterium]|nr:peptidylprolyl isomerase [Hyphomicrobiales bacterium]
MTQDPENTLILELRTGEVAIALRPDLAPGHVERIKTLTRQGFYDGVVFHRVIPGFMAQTGDPTGTGTGGSKLPDLKAEFTKTPFVRGTVGMARSASPDSANSQFFICYGRAPWLNGQYTVVGEVVSGMENADKLKKGAGESGMVADHPDRIVKATVATNPK